MKKKINTRLAQDIRKIQEWYNGDTDTILKYKVNNLISDFYEEISKISVTELAELLINGFEVEDDYNIVNLPNVFRFTIPLGSTGNKYLCTVVKDRAVVSWYDKNSDNVNSYEYSVQELIHHLNYKTWKIEGVC